MVWSWHSSVSSQRMMQIVLFLAQPPVHVLMGQLLFIGRAATPHAHTPMALHSSPGFGLSPWLIGVLTLMNLAFFAFVLGALFQSRKLPMVSGEERIELLNQFHQRAVFKYACRGLFERHKLLLSAHLCAKILSANHDLQARPN